MPNPQGTIEDLAVAWKQLLLCWQQTEQQWHDPVRREFEQRYWTPLEEQTRGVAKAAEQVAQTLAQAQRAVK